MAEPSADARTLVLEFSGELDADTAPAARAEGLAALALAWPQSLLVDLGAVTFIGSSGLAVLFELCTGARNRGIGFALGNVPDKVARVITISGLADDLGL